MKNNFTDRYLGLIIVLSAILIFCMPYVLTRPAFLDDLEFSDTGMIGDTIGGITAPFVGLLAAYLVYLSFQAQVKANQEIARVRHEDLAIANINHFIDKIEGVINNFEHSSTYKLHSDVPELIDVNYKGATAIKHYCKDVTKIIDILKRQEEHNKSNFHAVLFSRISYEKLREIFKICRFCENVLTRLHTLDIKFPYDKCNLTFLIMLVGETGINNLNAVLQQIVDDGYEINRPDEQDIPLSYMPVIFNQYLDMFSKLGEKHTHS